MMSNAFHCSGVRKPEASNGAMNMSRYISKTCLVVDIERSHLLRSVRSRYGHRSGHCSLSGE